MVCGFLQAKFCSTVANDIMLDTGIGVVRMWADETSRLSRFRMLFTSFADREFLLQIIPNLCRFSFLPCCFCSVSVSDNASTYVAKLHYMMVYSMNKAGLNRDK